MDPASTRCRPPWGRALAALPDAVSAWSFLSLWVRPLYFVPRGVANSMLVMLVECRLLHASPFLGTTAFSPKLSRSRKIKGVLGFGAFYLMFIAAWASTFKAWWPFLAFGWLLLAKLSAAIQPGQAPVERMRRMQSCWVLGAMAYLAGVFLTLFIPVPRFGITASVVSQLDLPGGGIQGNAEQVSATGMMSQSFASRAAGRRQCSLPWQELGREWRAIEASPHHWKSIGWGRTPVARLRSPSSRQTASLPSPTPLDPHDGRAVTAVDTCAALPWIDKPQIVIAVGVVHFGVLALGK